MQTIEIKNNIHKLVDNIENINLLNSIYQFLKYNRPNENGDLWESLSENQKNQVLSSLIESENDESTLIRGRDAILMR